MFLKKRMKKSTKKYSNHNIRTARHLLQEAEAVLVGIGAGMSESAGLTYSGERFTRYFSDFKEKYGISDMYSGGFYPFASQEEYWAWWSRHIYYNRFAADAGEPYLNLLELLRDKNYFILTTNVDHQVQKAGFNKKKLFYTQGDYGLFQCSVPCHQKTYDNRAVILEMLDKQENMAVPSDLIPYCPKCGAVMTVNLRSDNRFVEDAGWEKAKQGYGTWLEANIDKRIVYLELGVGMNTPAIIKYPFLKLTAANKKAVFLTVNQISFQYPDEINKQILQLTGDIGEMLLALLLQ
ncbi:Sir2 silent information regulator family NAD-dependent deacetylase [Streptococcus chenjunshii]|uniref:Sir2 silent information regulator family NAD-dependent deacetylase n=2 Tax=Streptococcus chenjunshii TaxID=2173853 RepID=A0A372KKY7_9STRE|nr:Sir2 family NAD-dependent protein deacetylase [Streptococcus chenjunshii]AXQ78039.1 Sir2 silent information regulator family NAD-dependent deacetylase [Streptococcus chenjunshii]RFU50418.1 Sir2 silent information regulator family NAD-dependent deacetylase [Streptococcus chenjunshii]RFU52646.1 Sir2 silent information regulator family NAD-dependent deacetylase [Streptococcus chenjunshii]